MAILMLPTKMVYQSRLLEMLMFFFIFSILVVGPLYIVYEVREANKATPTAQKIGALKRAMENAEVVYESDSENATMATSRNATTSMTTSITATTTTTSITATAPTNESSTSGVRDFVFSMPVLESILDLGLKKEINQKNSLDKPSEFDLQAVNEILNILKSVPKKVIPEPSISYATGLDQSDFDAFLKTFKNKVQNLKLNRNVVRRDTSSELGNELSEPGNELSEPVVLNVLVGKKLRIPGSVLPFSTVHLSKHTNNQIRDIVQTYVKDGAQIPSFVPNNSPPVGIEDSRNPFRSNA